jgi:mannose-6-phosphate isomerase-like protein (cupin superfamily)
MACVRLLVSPRDGQRRANMPFLDTSGLSVVERLPGWKGRFFHTATMTFADYEFTASSTIHEHFHPEEEVYEVIAGELEMFVDGVTQVVRPGIVAIVPSNAPHSVRALTDGRVIIVDHPARPEFG